MGASSHFCLAPKGLTPASRRPYEAIAYGCVPTAVSDDFQLPYSEWLRYEDFSVRIRESCLAESPEAARGVLFSRRANYPLMAKALEAVRPLFLYSGDGTGALE